MPKTVLIILAAVVALIVIVVLTGMRYLRADDADDEDDFDDDVPAEHGRSRSHGSHPAADQARSRRRQLDDMPDERQRQRAGTTRGARPVPARDERGADRRSSDQRGSGRGGQDRAWREDSAVTSRAGRPEQPVRDQRPARSGRRDHEDISEPIAAAARTSRPAPPRGAARGGDYDSLPGRRPLTPDYDRDPREGRDRRDSRDRLAGFDDDHASRRDSRDERDRRSNTRPNARLDARKTGPQQPDDELLPAVKPRQSRSKRESEGDWPSNEWDELSDVDYWAELASDKSFTAETAAAEPARTERREPRPDRGAGSDRPGRADRDGRTGRDARQDRGARSEVASAARADRDSRIGSESVTKQLSRPGREPDSGILPAARHRDLPADRPAAGRAADPRPAIADDDPLTSPSFPRIAADDSRTYRRSRSAAGDPGYGSSRAPDSRSAAGAGRTDQPSYPAMPTVEPVRGIDGAATTRRHALPAASADLPADAYRTPGYPAGDPGPGGADLYGSLPTSRSVPASNSIPASYQVPAATGAARNQAPAANYGGQDSATASYSLPAHPGGYQADYGGSGGYQAAASYPPGAGTSGEYGTVNGSSSAGYLPPVGNGPAGFAAETSASRDYQSMPAVPDGYRSDLGASSYQGTGSYEITSSYSLPAGPDRAAGYSAGGYQPADYPGYGGPASASGSHQRPEPGYLPGSYPAEPSLPAALPAAQPNLGYPVYPAPVPTGQDGYGAAPPALPGYGAAPYHDPPGYQPPAHEANGYAGADPYAVDPYGQYGDGGNGY